MDRGAWRVTIYRITSVRHDLATKPPPTIKKKYDGPPSFSSPVHPPRTKHTDETGQGQDSHDAWVHQSPYK